MAVQPVKKRATKKTVAPHPAPRTRAAKMNSKDRENNIIEQAVIYFAKAGFEGSTRDLAQQIGITQSLLYRYFPSKQALIDKVFERVYLADWNPNWKHLLRDRSQPLETRMMTYYREYSQVMLQYKWVRILIFAGLKQENINNRLFSLLKTSIFEVIIEEFHAAEGLSPNDNAATHELKLETVWALHASIFYIGMREWVYKTPTPQDKEPILEVLISGLLHSLKKICHKHSSPASR